MAKLGTLPHVKEVRGRGLLVGVEFDAPVGKAIKHGCIERRLLVTLIGSSVIRMVPPLIATQADCDQAYEILRESVEEAYQSVQ
jgi:acetylornithine/N-succinyldiaminopimelate aminotransferase